jgi:hypothetical protein
MKLAIGKTASLAETIFIEGGKGSPVEWPIV